MKITVKCVRVDEPHFLKVDKKIATWQWRLHIDADRFETGILRLPVSFFHDDVMKEARKLAEARLNRIQAENEVAKLVGTVLEGEL